MGCDIHAIKEKKDKYGYWINVGDPEIGRNYEMFAVLAGVRNYNDITPISEPKGPLELIDCSNEYYAMEKQSEGDAHSHSYVTLRELKAFDLNQVIDDHNLVLKKEEEGKVVETCLYTTGKHLGSVGKRKILSLWNDKENWLRIIKELEDVSGGNDEDARLCFFFDN